MTSPTPTIDPISISLTHFTANLPVRREAFGIFTVILAEAPTGWQVLALTRRAVETTGEEVFLVMREQFASFHAAEGKLRIISQKKTGMNLAECHVYSSRSGWVSFSLREQPTPAGLPVLALIREQFSIAPDGGLALHVTAIAGLYLAQSAEGYHVIGFGHPSQIFRSEGQQFIVYDQFFTDAGAAWAKFQALKNRESRIITLEDAWNYNTSEGWRLYFQRPTKVFVL